MADLVEQLRALGELHRTGTLSDAEFEIAKTRLLEAEKPAPLAPQNLSSPLLVLQNELADIDRQWELEREKYKVAGRYHSAIPDPGDGAKAGTTIAIFGGIWTAMATVMAASATRDGVPAMMALGFWLMPAFGVFFIFAGLSKGSEMSRKSDGFQSAETDYRRRRAAIQSKIAALQNS